MQMKQLATKKESNNSAHFQREVHRSFFRNDGVSFFKPSGQQSIQTKPDDKHDLTSSLLTGDPILEKTFDHETVVGQFTNSKGSHVKKIQEALIQLGIELSKFGADEKFGKETEDG